MRILAKGSWSLHPLTHILLDWRCPVRTAALKDIVSPLWKRGPVKVTSTCKRHLAPHPLCPGAKSPWILLLGGSNCSGMAAKTSVGPRWVWTPGMGRGRHDNSSGKRGRRHPNLTPSMLQDVHHHWSRACLQQPLDEEVWYLNSTPPCQAIPEQLNEWNSS